MQLLLVAAFGAVGVAARYIIDREFNSWLLMEFPISTFVINSLGSLAIGAISVLGSESGVLSKDLSVLLSVGLIGGFTTLSAFSLQTFQLLEKSQYSIAAAYFVGTPALGVIFAFVGAYVARAIMGLR